jgi:TolB protein
MRRWIAVVVLAVGAWQCGQGERAVDPPPAVTEDPGVGTSGTVPVERRAAEEAPASMPTDPGPAGMLPPDAAAAIGAAPNVPASATPFPAGLGGEVAFQSDLDGHTRLYSLDLATGRVVRLGTVGDWHDEEPAWSPDGKRLAFSSTRGGGGHYDIYVMNADGSQAVRLTDHAAQEQDPTWAADGQSVFFTAERDGRSEIYRVWLADRRVERLTSGIDRAIMPAASPDGKLLAYAAQTIMNFQVYVLDLQTGQTRQVTSGGGACRPAWRPDSREVAYVQLDREPSRLEVVREDGREPLIEDPRLWAYYPSYSPDGRWVAFSVSPEHHRGEDWDLAIAERATPGRFTRLTTGRGNDRVPVFRPRPAA